ncbi:MAG: extracellular solute-binding protein family 1 [Paenibacillus sp.]|nr:extracellular solute-binding protein family 1 [Paenibacillus sp.]
MHNKRYTLKIAVLAAMSAMIGLAGCSSKDANDGTGNAKGAEVSSTSNETPKAEKKDPVKLRMMAVGTTLAKEEVELYSKQVNAKYPYITIEQIPNANILELIAAGSENVPDIIMTDHPNLSTVIDAKYAVDLNPELATKKVDIGKLNKIAVDGIRSLGSNNQLLGLPVYLDKAMLYFNKDLFDKFAVPYLPSEMTYEDLMATVKRLTRQDAGIQYYGYRWVNMYTVAFHLGVSVLNPKTGKADLQNDSWKYALSFIKENQDMGNTDKVSHDNFFKDQTLAIWNQTMSLAYSRLAEEGKNMNWDMAALPYWSKKPKVAGPAKPMYMMVKANGKNKDAAIDAVSFISTSPEVQMALSKGGRISVLEDPEIKKQFATDLTFLKGKRIQEVYQYPFGDLTYTTAYESQIWPLLNTAPPAVMKGTDINTALREAEEQINKKIDEYLASRK